MVFEELSSREAAFAPAYEPVKLALWPLASRIRFPAVRSNVCAPRRVWPEGGAMYQLLSGIVAVVPSGIGASWAAPITVEAAIKPEARIRAFADLARVLASIGLR